MLFNQDKSLQQLKKLFSNESTRLISATFLSSEGQTCTVQPVGSDLILSGVNPFVMGTPDRKCIAIPRAGSIVLIQAPGERITLQNLCIAWVVEPETLLLVAPDYLIELGTSGAALVNQSGRTELTPSLPV